MKSHFYCSIVRAILLVVLPVGVFIASSSGAAGQSCLTLLQPHDPLNGWLNPDSVKMDTCTSPHVRKVKGWFQVVLSRDIFNLQAFSRDTVIVRVWNDVDTTEMAFRNALHNLDSSFGGCDWLKKFPDITDTISLASRTYMLEFNNYIDQQQALDSIASIPGVIESFYLKRDGFNADFIRDTAQNYSLAASDTEDPDDIPNLELQIGILDQNANSGLAAGMGRTRLGLQSNLRKLNVPLAWEITKGSKKIVYVNLDGSWYNPCSCDNPDPLTCYPDPGHGKTGVYPSGDIVYWTNKKKLNGTYDNPDSDGNYIYNLKEQTTGIFYPDPGDGDLGWWVNPCKDNNGNRLKKFPPFPGPKIMGKDGHGMGSIAPFNARQNDKGMVGVAPGCKVMLAQDMRGIDVDSKTPGIQRPDGYFVVQDGMFIQPEIYTQDAAIFVSTMGLPNIGPNFPIPNYPQVIGKKGLGVRSPIARFIADGYSSDVVRVSMPLNGVFDPVTGAQIWHDFDFNLRDSLPLSCFSSIFSPYCGSSELQKLPWDLKTPIIQDNFYWYFTGDMKDQLFTCQSAVDPLLTSSNVNKLPKAKYFMYQGYQVNNFDKLFYTQPQNGVSKTVTNDVPVLIPGAPSLFTISRAYQTYTAYSWFAAMFAGVTALMQSTDRYLDVDRTDAQYKPEWVPERAYDIITFTAKRILNNTFYSGYKDAAQGLDVYHKDDVYPLDPLKRYFTSTMGFGLVDAFRCAAHSIPHKGPDGTVNVKYKYQSGDALDWAHAAVLTKEDDQTLQTTATKKLLHLGKFYNATDFVLDPDLGVSEYERGGHVFSGEPEYKNNNGKTIVNTNLTVSNNNSTTQHVLAIDGIVTTENSSSQTISTTPVSVAGRILATGYLEKVWLKGHLKLGDLKAYSSFIDSPGGLEFSTAGDNRSEVWGEVEMNTNAICSVKAGTTIVRPGGIITMNGEKDIVIANGAVLEMDYASGAASKVVDGQRPRKIVVESGGTLRIGTKARAVELNCVVEVKTGGKFIFEEQSTAFVHKFTSEPGSLVLMKKGSTMELDATESISNGHFVAYGVEDHWNTTPAAPTTTPKAGMDERVLITAKRQRCGEPQEVASIKCSYDFYTLPIPYSASQLQASLKLRYTDVRNVKFDVKDVYTPPVEHCTFAADRETVKNKKYRTESGGNAQLDVLFKFEFAIQKLRDIKNNLWADLTMRQRFFSLYSTGIPDIAFRNGCQFFDQNTNVMAKKYMRVESASPNDLYAFSGLQTIKCNSVSVGNPSAENPGDCDFQRLRYAFKPEYCGVVEVYRSLFENCNIGVTDEGSVVKLCTNKFKGCNIGSGYNTSAQGIQQINEFEKMQTCSDILSGGRQYFRANNFTSFISGIRTQNAEAEMRPVGIEWDNINNRWGRREYGKNIMESVGVEENEFAINQTVPAFSDLRFAQPSDYAYLPCGKNLMSSVTSTYHFYKEPPGSLIREIATNDNRYRQGPSGIGARAFQVPIDAQVNWNNHTPASPATCPIRLNDDCDIAPEPDEPWRKKPWEHYDPRWSEIGPDIGPVIVGVVGIIKDPTESVYERKEAVIMATHLTLFADTSGTLTDTVTTTLSAIATDTAESVLLRSTAYLRLGMISMLSENYPTALTAFDSVQIFTNNAADSAAASFMKMRINAYLTDTTRGVVYDSLMNVMYHVAFSYQLGPKDTSGLVKPSEPVLPTLSLANNNSPVIEAIEPNPFGTSARVTFSLPASDDNVRLSLYDALGNTIANVAAGSFRNGKHILTLGDGILPPGMYILRLTSSFGVSVKTVIIRR